MIQRVFGNMTIALCLLLVLLVLAKSFGDDVTGGGFRCVQDCQVSCAWAAWRGSLHTSISLSSGSLLCMGVVGSRNHAGQGAAAPKVKWTPWPGEYSKAANNVFATHNSKFLPGKNTFLPVTYIQLFFSSLYSSVWNCGSRTWLCHHRHEYVHLLLQWEP
jgi:hypothetical protein